MNKKVHYIGLDVHKETIAVSIAPQNTTGVRRYGIIGGTLDAVDKLLKKIGGEDIALMHFFSLKFKLRKTLAEHPFGTIKRSLGYTHFLLKGLEKVRTEWSLITLVYNIKRVLNLVSLEKLMQAVA